jgi:stage V sporulation protein S
MDRFFSKLDLRDIKIDPRSTSFPPDAEDEIVDDEPTARNVAPVEDEAEVVFNGGSSIAGRAPHGPSWSNGAAAAEQPSSPGYVDLPLDDDLDIGHSAPAIESAGVVDDPAQDEVLKVSARSRPSAVAGAIAGVVREAGRAEVQAIGAGATNQAVKAVAIARDYLRETGIEAICLPAFIDVTIENEDRTAIRLVVEPR